MTISELITQLETIKTEHGDLPVWDYNDGCPYEATEVIVQDYGFGPVVVIQ